MAFFEEAVSSEGIDVYTPEPFDPYSISFDMPGASEDDAREMAVRATVRETKLAPKNANELFLRNYAGYLTTPQPLQMDAARARVGGIKEAENSILSLAAPATDPHPSSVEAIAARINDSIALRDMSDEEASVWASLDLPDEPIKQIQAYRYAADRFMYTMVTKHNPDGWDNVTGFLKLMLVPGKTQWDTGFGDTHRELLNRFHSATLQNRIRMFPEIEQAIENASGKNPITRAIYLNHFFVETPAEFEADFAIDGIDLFLTAIIAASAFRSAATASVIGLGVKRFSSLVKARATFAKASALGADGAAADLKLGAMAADNKGMNGATAFDARAASDPFDRWASLGGGTPKGGEAGPVAAVLEAEDAIVAERLRQRRILSDAATTVPARTTLKTTELVALERDHLIKQFLKNADVPHRAEVEASDVSGLTVRVTTFDSSAPTVAQRLKLEAKQDTLAAKLETIQKDLDEWDKLPAATKDTKEAQGLYDWLALAKRETLATLNDVEKTLAISPETAVSKRVFYTQDDFGQLDGGFDMAWWASKVATPDHLFEPIQAGVSKQASFIEMTQDAFKHKLGRAFAYMTKGLNKDSRALVDSVLVHGDTVRREFSQVDLLKGIDIPGAGTVRLNEKEVAAYFKARDTFRYLWAVQDVIQHRLLTFQKARYAKGLNLEGVRFDGVVYTKNHIPSEVREIYTDVPSKTSRIGTIVPFTKESKVGILQRVKDGKARIVRFDKPLKRGDDWINWGVISNKRLRALPKSVLPYRVGYVPMLRKNVNYVVRREISAKVDGVKTKREVVASFFDKEAEAKTWAANQPDAANLKVYFEKDLRKNDDVYRQETVEAAFTGVFRQEMLGENLKYGPNQITPPRAGAFEGMLRYMGHVGNVYPQNEWRLSVVSKFMNSAREHLADPHNWKSPFKAQTTLSPEQLIGFERFQGWLKDTLRIPTRDEMEYNRLFAYVARRMEKFSALDGARNFLLSKADLEASRLMKSAAFHGLLGWFNPRQFFVQAAGSVLAFSIDPLAAPAVMRRQLFLRTIAFMDTSDPGYRHAVRNVISKSAGLSPDEAEHLAAAFKQSNLQLSLRANADYSAAEQSLPIGISAVSRVANLGLYPFREGELFMRSYGFTQAYLDTIKESPLLARRPLTPFEVDGIVGRAQRLTLNMTRANQALWQKGGIGVPTQFLSVQAKFWEEMAPWAFGLKYKNVTEWKGHRLQMLGMHALLFGSMGVPFAAYYREPLLNWLASPEGGGISDLDTSVLVYGGITDFLFSHMLGVEHSISEAISIPEGVLKLYDNLSADDPVNARNLFGASWSIGSRVVDAATGPFAKIALPWKWHELGTDDFVMATNDIASITSGWRNASKGRLYRNNMAILDSRGEDAVMLLDDESSVAVMWGKALFGVRTYHEIWKEELVDFVREDEKTYAEFMGAAKKLLRIYTRDGLPPAGSDLDEFTKRMDILLEVFDTEAQKAVARKKWWNYIKADDTDLAKAQRDIQNIIRAQEGQLSDKQEAAIGGPPLMNPDLQFQQNYEQEDARQERRYNRR